MHRGQVTSRGAGFDAPADSRRWLALATICLALTSACPTDPNPIGDDGDASFGQSLGASEADAHTSWQASDDDAGSAWAPWSPAERYEGKTLTDWAVAWGRWSYSEVDCRSTALDTNGSFCALYQDPDSPVFFLDAGKPVTRRTRCRVPAGKAILVPLAMFTSDNAGLAVDTWRSEAELMERTRTVMETMTDLRLVVDGVPVSELEAFAVPPTRFNYVLPPEPNWYTCNSKPGVTGLVEPSFIAGYFVLLPPPAPGAHTLEYGGILTLDRRPDASAVMTQFVVEASTAGL